MTTTPASDTSNADLSWPVLLGLRAGSDPAEWGRIRASQLHAARGLAVFLLGVNLVCAALTVSLFMEATPLLPLAGWAALVTAVAATISVRRLSTPRVPDGYVSMETLRKTAWEGAALALAWSVPLLLFGSQPGSPSAYGLWLVMSLLMIATVLALSPLALSALLFLGILGLVGTVNVALAGEQVAAIATALVTGLLVFACLNRARSLVVIRAAELALSERDDTVSLLLREFEDSGADWLWETDSARRVVKANPRFAFACGFDPLTMNGMPLLQVLAGPAWETGNFAAGLRQLAEKLKSRESFRDLRLPVHVKGEERWWEISASPRLDERGTFCGFRGVGSDVTEQRASADKINRMARFDTLTGLPNRLMINETLVRAMQEADKWGSRSAFMMLDLDRFKAVNDTLGHPVGDRLLGRVSERLAQLMSPNEMCGRLGGDEFAVVIRDARDTGAVEALAHRIIETLSRPYEVDQHTLHVGASVGLAVGPRDGRTAEMLIRSADLALYRAKDAGRGVFRTYEPQLHVQAEERRVLEMALRKAIENNEMHLNYQPVVDAGTGGLTGFEALLRWTHPELGPISPAKFIPLAEEARLIESIGEWVLRTACDEAASWPSHIRIAVNASADQLQNANFVTVVTSALANSGLSAERLELEVTESVFMHEGLGATKTLERVLDLGVRLSLDDFGTGYSSLGYLSRTRFSSIKIDRSFVQGASKGVREAIAIIRAVVALAKSLGMATTAEGVETEAEHQMVQDLGCTKVQGFYFGRPLPVEEARTLANRRWSDAQAA
ncbi:diguanylate cyclase/phosphodiesterase with PAS/PAC sensor(s) [Sphingomonas gellani]|uniref:Diguanylate cyclase/phosphodiesterase with PAS/PAC sensor(S) n=1 Tax=Sphingomonas gellani TaxID=1166340 RepID=A0A1H8FRJ9_9SPHN|nr:GGDEF and EAL domain-containing protein [Sphingomonas gellani]SEN34316.1 diguanylate cyclase/phosphodiesterase with PAS/PAC sensor(s) [Sphingomonas gellani]